MNRMLFLVCCALFACSTEVEVNSETLKLSILGEWKVSSSIGSYYVNDSLVGQSVFNAPFDSVSAYNDFTIVTFAKDSIWFMYKDSTVIRDNYQVVHNKLVLHYTDSLGYFRSENIIRLTRYDLYQTAQGVHRDTVLFSLQRAR